MNSGLAHALAASAFRGNVPIQSVCSVFPFEFSFCHFSCFLARAVEMTNP